MQGQPLGRPLDSLRSKLSETTIPDLVGFKPPSSLIGETAASNVSKGEQRNKFEGAPTGNWCMEAQKQPLGQA